MEEVNNIENSETLSYKQKQENIDELNTKLKTENPLTQSGPPLIDKTSITNKKKNSSKKVEGKNKEYQGLGHTDQSDESSSQEFQSDRLFQLANQRSSTSTLNPDQRSYIEKLNNKIIDKLEQSSREEFVNSSTLD